MNKYVTQTKHSNRRLSRFTLYDVAKTPWSRHLVSVLCVSLLISPVERVLANVDDGVVVSEVTSLDPVLLEQVIVNSVSDDEIAQSSDFQNLPKDTKPTSGEANNSENNTSVPSGDLTTGQTDYSLATNEILTESVDQAEPGTENLSESTLVDAADLASSLATDIDENAEPIYLDDTSSNEVVVDVLSDSQVVFDRNNCVLVNDGTYYCRTGEMSESERPDGVYAYPDKDGDLEIYIQRDGQLTQITHNTVEDASPWYDAVTNTIVWHRSVNDRYQIISYDVNTGKETQITSDTTNNMEPTRFGEYIAWQSWIDNNWEIVLYDGEEMRRITVSPEHDVAPQIRNGLLVWSRGSGSQQTAEIYNLATGEYISIKDVDGGIVSNPRMVVMYESRDNMGDMVVKGYDMITGQIIPISTNPAQVPVRIPSPEDTPEPRALIHSAVQKQDIDDELDEEEPEDDEESVVANYDFDADDTLVLFDYGEEGDVEVMEEEMQVEEEFTLDLRPEPTPEEEHKAELTLVVPPLGGEGEAAEDELTMMVGSEEGR